MGVLLGFQLARACPLIQTQLQSDIRVALVREGNNDVEIVLTECRHS
jgi:hypothetical protein